MFACFPKKRCLGPQISSSSSGLEKLPKIVNGATIMETKRNNGTILGIQVE